MRSDTTPAQPRNLAEIWQETMQRVADLAAGVTTADEGRAIVPLPGTSIWSVVAHLVRRSAEAASADQPGCDAQAVETDAADYAGLPLPQLLSAWAGLRTPVCARIAADDSYGRWLIIDLVMHEHDLRTTLDKPGYRDSEAVLVALDELAGQFSDRVQRHRVPALRVTVEQWGTIAGAGPSAGCVVADRFEFVRAMAGRRSATEVQRWNWGVPAASYLDLLSGVPLPTEEVHERDPRVPEHMRDREFVL